MGNLGLFLAACLWTSIAFSQNAASQQTSSSERSAEATIQQIEDDLLQAERSTDPAILDRILADDFAGVGTNGATPGKSESLKSWHAHEGQAPPYTVEESDMRIIVRGDTAVAAYTKTFTAKENGNVAHQDTTDVFTQDHGTWKLRVSRYTFCQK